MIFNIILHLVFASSFVMTEVLQKKFFTGVAGSVSAVSFEFAVFNKENSKLIDVFDLYFIGFNVKANISLAKLGIDFFLDGKTGNSSIKRFCDSYTGYVNNDVPNEPQQSNILIPQGSNYDAIFCVLRFGNKITVCDVHGTFLEPSVFFGIDIFTATPNTKGSAKSIGDIKQSLFFISEMTTTIPFIGIGLAFSAQDQDIFCNGLFSVGISPVRSNVKVSYLDNEVKKAPFDYKDIKVFSIDIGRPIVIFGVVNGSFSLGKFVRLYLAPFIKVIYNRKYDIVIHEDEFIPFFNGSPSKLEVGVSLGIEF